jgi:hypothetical protein
MPTVPGGNDLAENATSAQMDEWLAARQGFRDRQRDWTRTVMAQVLDGTIQWSDLSDAEQQMTTMGTHEDARSLQSLPETLYHATTAFDVVAAGGLKVRDVHGQHGLGGGSSDVVSFTTDRKYALAIAQSQRELRSLLRGDTTLADLSREAEAGGFRVTWEKGMERSWGRTWREDALKDINVMGAAYEGYQTWREQATGHPATTFFTTNLEQIRDMDPRQIGVVEFRRSSPKALGYRHNAAESEWRTAPSAVQVVGPVVKFNPNHQPAGSYHGGEFAPKAGGDFLGQQTPEGGEYAPKKVLHLDLAENSAASSPAPFSVETHTVAHGWGRPDGSLERWAEAGQLQVIARSQDTSGKKVVEFDDLARAARQAVKKVVPGQVAWGSYTQAGYRGINDAARRPPLGLPQSFSPRARDLLKMVDDLDERVAHSPPLMKDTIVARGLTGNAKEMLDKMTTLRPGDVIVEPGFSSTTLSRKGAADWASKALDDDGQVGVVMEITIPKGTRVMLGVLTETELILKRGTRYRFTGNDGTIGSTDYGTSVVLKKFEVVP